VGVKEINKWLATRTDQVRFHQREDALPRKRRSRVVFRNDAVGGIVVRHDLTIDVAVVTFFQVSARNVLP